MSEELETVEDWVASPITTKYAFDVPMDDFKALMKSDEMRWNGPQLLESHFNDIPGVYEIDFNGHFGNQFIFHLLSEDDTPETHQKVVERVKERIAGIRQYIENSS